MIAKTVCSCGVCLLYYYCVIDIRGNDSNDGLFMWGIGIRICYIIIVLLILI